MARSLLDDIDWTTVGIGAAVGAVVAYVLWGRSGEDSGTVDGEVLPYEDTGAHDPGRPPPPPPVIPPDAPFSQAVVQWARRDIGVTEEGGDNRGPRVEEMQRNTGNRPGDAWCASAVSTWIFEAAKAMGRKRPIRGSAGVKELVQQMQDASNPLVGWIDVADLRANPSLVQPGMLVMWTKSTYGSPMGHVGLVQSTADASGNFKTIEGNAGANSDRVVEANHPLSSQKLYGMGFFREPSGATAGLGATRDPAGIQLFSGYGAMRDPPGIQKFT